jgi:hypothetical protein
VKSDPESRLRPSADEPSPWTPAVVRLLEDWARRAGTSSDAHYRLASSLSRANIRFGVPVVALTTAVGTSVFATLEHQVNTVLRVIVGMISVIAAVLASLQTFLRFGERSEKHRAAAEAWQDLRREIDEMVALHPDYLASQGDPKEYLDDVRSRMGEIAKQSPEMGEQGWWRPVRRYRVDEQRAAAADPEPEAEVGRAVAQR